MTEKSRFPDIKKGTILVVKAPPYYTKAYLYEIVSAGEKTVRASLYKSPTVRKSWGRDELVLLFDMEIVRLATDKDISELSAAD